MIRTVSAKSFAALITVALLFGSAITVNASHHEVTGIVTGTSPDFGNVWTDIKTSDFDALGVPLDASVSVVIMHGDEVAYDQALPLVAQYSDVERGEPLIIHDDDYMTIAISFGNFTETYSIGAGDDWTITITPIASD